MSRTLEETTVDPITFEVISHKFAQLTTELATTLQRTSGSVVVTEGMDFAIALADERGSVFAVGDYTTVHAGALQHAIEWTLENRGENPGIEEGDMFLLSDPWVGVVHQPDMALVVPIFVEGRLLAWSATAMHMLDTGGALPGGLNSAATDVFSEPAPIPPIKIVRGSVLQRDVEEMILRRSRLPQLLALDLRAMIAANKVAIERMAELAAEYSALVLRRVIGRQLENAEAEVRARLRELPDGTWSDVQLCEVAGDGDRNVYAVRGTMTKSGEELSFDLSATDDQAGFFNSTWPATQGGLTAAILPLICPDLTWAPGGVLRPMKFDYRPGSIVAAEFPAAVSAGPISGGLITATLATMLISKMLSSASPKLKENLLAVTAACIPANIFRGRSKDGHPLLAINIEVVPGGTGARSWRDGDHYSAVALGPSSRIPNVEHQEHDYPLLWLYRRELSDSAGAGEFRGGVAGESAVIPYGVAEPLELMVAAHGVALPSSRGINGGLPAKALSFRVHRDAEVLEKFAAGRMPVEGEELGKVVDWPHPKTAAVKLGLLDVFIASGAGGGGYGDPIERDPASVAADVHERYVSVKRAEDLYGVVMSGRTVDRTATDECRARLRGERIGTGPIGAPMRHSGSHGLTMLSENVAVTAAGDTACANCSTRLSEGDQNYKAGAIWKAADLLALGLVWVEPKKFVDQVIELRQFFCPTCGTLLENELAPVGEAVTIDRELVLPDA